MKDIQHLLNMSATDIIVALVVILICVYCYYKGKGVIAALIVSFYPAILMYKFFPYTENFVFFKQNSTQIFFSHLLILVVLFLISFYAMNSLIRNGYSRSGIPGIIDSLLLGLSFVALCLVVLFHVLPATNVYDINSVFFNVFRSDLPSFLALILPIALLKYLS